MTKCQENFNACANAPGQYAATVALDHPELCTQLRDIFARAAARCCSRAWRPSPA